MAGETTGETDRVTDSISIQGGEPMNGSGGGSDTRAGSPEGGSASGEEDEPPMAGAVSPAEAGLPGGASPQGQGASPGSEALSAPEKAAGDVDAANPASAAVANVGVANPGPHAGSTQGRQDGQAGDDADAATG